MLSKMALHLLVQLTNRSPFKHTLPLSCISTRFNLPNPRINTNRRMSSSSTTASLKEEEKKTTAPYGSWKSPITADVVSGAEKRLGGFAVDGHGRLLWVESRPNEAGRVVLVREREKLGDDPADVLPEEFAVRTTAQEYGGQAFAVSGDTVIFSNYKDQRLYKYSFGG